MGGVRQRWSLVNAAFSVEGEDGRRVMDVRQMNWCDAENAIYEARHTEQARRGGGGGGEEDGDGFGRRSEEEQKSRIVRVEKGLGRVANKYVIEFAEDTPLTYKVLLIGACVLFDFTFHGFIHQGEII